MIRAVTFDFWETLYVEGPARHRRQQLREEYALGFFLGLGAQVSATQMKYAFELLWHDLEHLRMVNHSGLSAEEVGRRLARTVNVPVSADQAARLGEQISWAGREEPPIPAEGALEVLQVLRGRVKLALISDTTLTLGRDLYAVMEAHGIAQLLDHFTFSDQTGTTKPELRQFHHTLHRLGCRPEEAVHVGDTEDSDVAGARGAGMRAIRLLRDGQDPATIADATVKTISEVPDVLNRWGVE